MTCARSAFEIDQTSAKQRQDTVAEDGVLRIHSEVLGMLLRAGVPQQRPHMGS